MKPAHNGYILVEAVVSLAILSVVSIVIQGGLRQAIETRGQAQDYTTARFLCEEVANRLELQPRLPVGFEEENVFPEPNARFHYTAKVEKVDVPLPPLPNVTLDNPELFMGMFMEYMGRISVTVSWTRAGQSFQITGETLLRPEQIWVTPGMGGI